MDENVFRIVVTAAVVLASLMFVVQAGIMFALYKAVRKAQENAEQMIGKAEPLIQKAGPAIQHVEELVQRAGPVLERIGPLMDEAMPAIRKTGPVLDEARQVVAKAGRLVERGIEIAATANGIMLDARPQVKQISVEALEMARQGREQIERVGDLVHEAGDRARSRLEQIDHGVDTTIEQVEQVGGAVKRAVMIPVREVNGLAAGVSAAVATLMRARKSSVDSATQDEEMFI